MPPDPAQSRQFKGPHAELLEKFATLMDRLWVEHRTSPTRAAGEEFYAWGNIDFEVIMSAHLFDDLVEIRSKFGNLDINKDTDGKISCTVKIADKEKRGSPAQPQTPSDAGEILKMTMAALNHYYYSAIR